MLVMVCLLNLFIGIWQQVVVVLVNGSMLSIFVQVYGKVVID